MAGRRFGGIPIWAKIVLCILGIGVLFFLVVAVMGCFSGLSPIDEIKSWKSEEQIEQEAPSEDETTNENEEQTTEEAEVSVQSFSYRADNGTTLYLKI